jgi:MSHA pilin protein MshC
MKLSERGFSLIELVTVMILISIISVTLMSRLGSVSSANLTAGRDDLIAALFFAQQTAMARSNIQLILTANAINVTENGVSLQVHSQGYPLSLPSGVSAAPVTLSYDKLGRTSATSILLTASGGLSATIVVEATGYAH